MTSNFKITGYWLTSLGPIVSVEMPRNFFHALPANATIVVDGVEAEKIEVKSVVFFAGFKSLEAYEQYLKTRTFNISGEIANNAGREWYLRFDEESRKATS